MEPRAERADEASLIRSGFGEVEPRLHRTQFEACFCMPLLLCLLSPSLQPKQAED
jgi:hypothetical protein